MAEILPIRRKTLSNITYYYDGILHDVNHIYSRRILYNEVFPGQTFTVTAIMSDRSRNDLNHRFDKHNHGEIFTLNLIYIYIIV